MIKVSASEARIPSDLFNRIVYQGDIVQVLRRGGKAIYIIDEASKKLLEKAEDILDAYEADLTLQHYREGKLKTIPAEEVRKRLGL